MLRPLGRPGHHPQAIDADLEERIVWLRKSLDRQGFDAGAATILEAFKDRSKAFPSIQPHYRVRHGKIDAAGVITLRHSRLHHIGLGKHLRRTKVTVLIDDLDIASYTATPSNSSANSS